jgi:uncharacterized protein YfbU (UPF0304 family)
MATTISFRIDDDTKVRLDALVESRGINISRAFRDALTDKIAELEMTDLRSQLRFTLKERMELVFQLRTLISVSKDEDERNSYENYIEILVSGYELNYRDLVEWFDPNGFDVKSCRETHAILHMFSELAWGYRKLNAAQKKTIDAQTIEFAGFDGNNEPGYMAYARFVLFKLNLYESLRAYTTATGLNSHFPMLPKYRSMLNVFSTLSKPNRPLTLADIQAIVAAD